MIDRLIHFPSRQSFFLFGARGTGKTFELHRQLKTDRALYFDLLDPELFHTLSLRPKALSEQLDAEKQGHQWVVIDEVQRIPELLNIVHQQIETSGRRFALTGSSARKLKRGGANLLAGRAILLHLFPLTSVELGDDFDLTQALEWGTLPKLLSLKSAEEKRDYLRTYTYTYVQEEITQEQIIRRLDPFRRFLPVAAQMSGQILNFSTMAREVGTTVMTIQSYFQILEDTLVGFLLDPFHESIRKRQRENPKFYFFDTGIQRALQNTLTVKLLPQTHAFGQAFENFVVNQIVHTASYGKKDFRFSYIRTKDDVEIDLVIERPGLKRALVEIKSTSHIRENDVRALKQLGSDVPHSEPFCLSLDPTRKKINGIPCLPWQEGLRELGLSR